MTTNARENIDEALKRPGRMDPQVYFGPATTETVELCFLRMYQKDGTDEASNSELQSMARTLASKIPAEQFTAADIQGHFFIKANDPIGALDDVDDWVKTKLQPRKEQKRPASHPDADPSGSGLSRISTTSAGNEEASSGEVLAHQKSSSDEAETRNLAQARTRTPPNANDEVGSVFEKLNPSNLSLTEELSQATTKEPVRLDIDIKKATRNDPKEQDNGVRRARITPSSAILPRDAVGMRPLSAYFTRFYVPKGSETDPEEV